MAKNLEPVSGSLNTATYPNRFNVVIPIEAPFFRTGIVITAPGRPQPLIEGLDYYLGYYYQEAAEAFKEAVYGGIILLHATEIEYEIVPVGREYRIPSSEIAKWLVREDIKDPRNVDWSELMRYAPTIPAIDPPQSLEEAILRDEVVAALHELATVLQEQAQVMEGAYDDCVQVLTRTGKKIYEDDLYQHHLKPNAHPYTGNNLSGSGFQDVRGTGTYLRGNGAWIETYSADELAILLDGGTVPDGELTTTGDNCLMVAGRAVDATLAFGRTFNQLLDVMSTAGIQQRDIDALMGMTLGNLYGRLSVENNNTLTYKTANDNHLIEFNGGSILLRTKLRMELAADRDNNDPGVAVEVGAGINTLMVHSGPDAVAPVYNGVFLITPEQVKLYIHSLILQTANAYFRTSPTLDIVGTGKEVAPVMMTAKPPTATDTVEGLFALSNVPTPAPLPGVALSQTAVTQVRDDLDMYVDDTFTINGKTFNKTTQNLELTAADFQLGNVNNTNPTEKPVSTALAAALALKALLTHTHTMADLINVPTASGTVAGMMQLHDAVDATTDKAVTAKQGYLLDQKVKTSEDKAKVLLPAWAVIGSQYGKPGFLPIPAQGNYEGYIRTGNMFCAMRRDESMLYILRNGYTGFPNSEAVYYAYANINADGSLTNFTQSSFRYHPVGLTDKYPGVTFKEHLFSDTECGLFADKDGNYYAVLFDGSMDYRKHTRVVKLAEMTLTDIAGNPFVAKPFGTSWNCFLYKDAFYLCCSAVGSAMYRMFLVSMPIDEFSKSVGVATAVPLTGARLKQGDWNMFFKEQSPADVETPDVMCWITPEGKAKWGGMNPVHGPMATRFVGRKDQKVRVAHQLTYYFSNGTTSIWGGSWYTTFSIDLEAKTVTHENADQFPIRFDAGGLFYKDASVAAQKTDKLIAHRANNFANCVEDELFYYISATDQTLGSQTAIYVQERPSGRTLYEYGDPAVEPVQSVNVGSGSFNAGMGSVYRNSMTHPVILGGDSKKLVLSRANDAAYGIEMEYTTDTTYDLPGWSGYGPSNNRNVVSWTVHDRLSRMPVVKTGTNNQEFLDGTQFSGPESWPYRNVAGTTAYMPGNLSISQSEWDKFVSAMRAKAQTLSGAANGYCAERLVTSEQEGGRLLFSLWVMGTTLSSGPLCIASIGMQSLRGGLYKADVYMFLVTPVIDANGALSFNVPNVQLIEFKNDAADMQPNGIQHSVWGGRRPGQPLLLSSDGVNFTLYIPGIFSYQTVGGSGRWHWVTKLTKNAVGWSKQGFSEWWADQPAYSVNAFMYARHLGGVVGYSFNISSAILSGSLKDYDAFVSQGTNAPKTANVILGAMETAEGWIMYITEEVYLYVKQHPITVPTFELDLSVAFAGNNANKTFHVHVEGYEEAGVWKGRYAVGLTKLPDTDTRLYVGTVVTDDKRIIQMDLRRAKRLGRVRALIEHSLDATKHENSNKLAKQFSPLGITKSAPVDVAAPELSYLSQVGAAKRLGATPSIVTIPAPIGGSDWSMAPVEKFWKRAEAFPLPAAAAQAAKDLGMVAVSFASGKLYINEYFGVKANFTNTKGAVRLKIVTDDYLVVSIDGVVVAPSANGYTTMYTLDFNISPGQHTLALEVGEGPGFSPVWTAFILYDWDGTTERELLRSGASSLVGMTRPQLARSKSGTVLRAHQITVDATATVLGVTDVVTGQGIPHVVEPNGASQTVYYATEWYPEGSDSKRTLGANDAVVNLMIAPSI